MKGLVALGVLFVLALIGGGAYFGVSNALHEETRTCTVVDKTREVTSDGNGGTSKEQRVYTEECGIFTVEDALFAGHFNSADTFARIDEGKTYRITSRGHRVGFFSMFPNIVQAEEVTR